MAASDRTAGAGPFTGTWNVHGAMMHLTAAGTGTLALADGGTDTLRLTRFKNPDRALVTIVASTPGRSACPADGRDAPGDQFELRIAAPQLLVSNFLISHRAPIDLTSGNPYWCGPRVAPRLRNRCGA